MRIQSDVKARAWFSGARAGDPTLQIVIKLLRDQPFLIQRPVPLHLLPQGRLTEKSNFERRYIGGILATQRIESIGYPVPTPLDDLAREFGDALAKHRDKAPIVETQELVDQ